MWGYNLKFFNMMEEIEFIYLPTMNNGAHFQFLSDVLAHAEADATVMEKASKKITPLKEALVEEDKGLKIPRKSMLTDDIGEWSVFLGSLYVAYKHHVAAYLKSPVAEEALSAKYLNQHLFEYNISTKMQLNRKIGMFTNLIADLEGDWAEHVDRLSLSSSVAAIKQANIKLHELMEERTEERKSRRTGVLRTARTKADKAYYAFIHYINALAVVEEETDFTDFFEYVNAQVKYYKQNVLGNSASGKEEGTEGDRPVIPEEPDTDEDDRPEIPDEPETEPGKDENGDDLPPIE